MTNEEKIVFIEQMTDGLKKSLVADIEAGEVPEEWDGHELRELFADRAATWAWGLSGRRRREYDKTVLVNNL